MQRDTGDNYTLSGPNWNMSERIRSCEGEPMDTGMMELNISPTGPRLTAKKACVLVIVMLLINVFAAAAQNLPTRSASATIPSTSFSISGVVLDPSNAPIAGAKVVLSGRKADNQPSTSTDAGGGFRF